MGKNQYNIVKVISSICTNKFIFKKYNKKKDRNTLFEIGFGGQLDIDK